MIKQEIINSILKQNKSLFDNFSYDYNALKKSSKEDLIKHLTFLNNVMVVEVMKVEEAKNLICNSCEDCKNKIARAEKIHKENKVLMRIDEIGRYHIIGIC